MLRFHPLLLAHVLEELVDGESESDEGDGGADPGHERALVGQAGTQECQLGGVGGCRVGRRIAHGLAGGGGKPANIFSTALLSCSTLFLGVSLTGSLAVAAQTNCCLSRSKRWTASIPFFT